LGRIDAFVECGEVSKAEELLWQALQAGCRPSGACVDTLISALDNVGNSEKAEEWLWQALERAIVPNETSFNKIILAACRRGSSQKVEEIMARMLQQRIRPSQQIFNTVIRMFSEQHKAPKVEEWLLNAGQAGWTPEQIAFESVVILFAEVDALKAEEWLSRAQRTDYQLPDVCFNAVIEAFVRVRNLTKANEWLSRMFGEKRMPSSTILHDVANLLIETGGAPHADAWLKLFSMCNNTLVDELRRALLDAFMEAGNVDCAEKQLMALSIADAKRTQTIAFALLELGDAARAKNALDGYHRIGGVATPEINAALLTTCVAMNDIEGTEAVARLLAAAAPLTNAQASILQNALGNERAEAFMADFKHDKTSSTEPVPNQAMTSRQERAPKTMLTHPQSPTAKKTGMPSPPRPANRTGNSPKMSRRSGVSRHSPASANVPVRGRAQKSA